MPGRRHLRVKVSFKVKWSVEGGSDQGVGIINNMSVSGIGMITDKVFEPPAECFILLEPITSQEALPKAKRVKLIWCKQIQHEGIDGLQCGLQLINEA